ncbi:MAG: class I SAM-dependent methyltransferase [Proteobacteria bacterium]|nr:class I SAM-dependent methyltransferase [Pseudomonadota bacterium]MDA1131739.1 class I SAM-dependent methyltransferase [Pseudomonadota bacterium]
MSHETTVLTAPLYEYLLRVGVREAPVLRRLRDETLRRWPDSARMQIAPEQGALIALLVTLTGARHALEAGVFTGYSALAVALALPADGVLVACDVSDEWTALGRPYWDEAGVGHKIDLRLAPAIETMDALLADGRAGWFDFVFLDAEKTEYAAYYERALALLRPGGLILVDNVLWSGRVVDPAADDADTAAIRAFNELVRDDERVSLALVPIADGLTLAVKRP